MKNKAVNAIPSYFKQREALRDLNKFVFGCKKILYDENLQTDVA